MKVNVLDQGNKETTLITQSWARYIYNETIKFPEKKEPGGSISNSSFSIHPRRLPIVMNAENAGHVIVTDEHEGEILICLAGLFKLLSIFILIFDELWADSWEKVLRTAMMICVFYFNHFLCFRNWILFTHFNENIFQFRFFSTLCAALFHVTPLA